MSMAMKLGLMVPANNTTMESELLAWLPRGSTCKTLRIPRGKGLLTLDDIPAYVDRALTLAASFAGDDLDLVVYGCTAAGFLAGPARDAEIAASLARVTGKPVVTTAGAMLAGLRECGAHGVALVTPYLDTVNDALKAFLAQSGFEVRRFNSFRSADTDALAKITGADVAALSRETMSGDCDALFIACSQLPTRAALIELRGEFRQPVMSSIQATAREVQKILEPPAAL
jgi:maleate cis-trans isomerase